MTTLTNLASSLTEDWRSSDGGLTLAAGDVAHVGACLDRLLKEVEEGKTSAEKAEEEMYQMAFRASTGAEGDVIEEARRLNAVRAGWAGW